MLCITDYDMANLRSVQKGFERVGHEATITSDPAVVAAADRIVLPGVGAFRDAIAALEQRDLVEPIKEVIAAGKPFLGICLGLHLLFEVSYEEGEHQGLGVLPGRVVRFDIPREYKVPHMGWNQIRHASATRPPIYEGIDSGEYFYFVHCYYVEPADPSVIATTTDYGPPAGPQTDQPGFCSSIYHNNLTATQFHPEKSQQAGLRLLKNFAEWKLQGKT
ncbi:MAG: imidazole glycerol phosphate synthase subunit HisH [Planctomycetota bacterium]